MGDVKEAEEPEGKAVVGPSGEAILHSSGNTPSFLSFSLLLFYFFFFCKTSHQPFHCEMGLLFNLAFLSSSWSILHADESKSEEEVKVETKEEEELGILQSWMEVGGLPALDEVEAQKLL